ncbi:EAL domain-containing protein [Parasphingopyxis sp. CP4]|uniref:EAL domain-containing protein n=1 Tax=Parasphingopyxis sp. CP4 TaxID=2724527 RepID=UPI0015A49772|nr:EAL domain-containing protein [Parasphingopyxis sp. CP4]QLC23028.1 EAL domain-containing protein [Parasphingopyxis sp. CP4]
MLPAIVTAQFVSLALILTATFGLQTFVVGGWATAFSGTGLAVSAAMLLFSRSPTFERSPPHLLIRGTVPAAALLGLCFTFGAFEIALLAQMTIGILFLVALGMAGLLLLFALAPIHAAAFAFIISAIVTASILSAEVTIVVIGLACFICFWLAGVRTVRIEQKQVRDRARNDASAYRANRLLAGFEANGGGWFWETDRSGKIVYLSPKLIAALKRPRAEIIGQPFATIIRHQGGAEDGERALGFHLSTRSAFKDVEVRAAVDDEELWWAISGHPVIDEIGQFRGYAGSGTDLTEKRRSQAEATRLARYDSLTGLANRQEMQLALSRSLEEKGGRPAEAALMLLDLDRFKAVNDTLGHPVGDELLKQASQRLFRVVGDRGLVGRLGGDEFEVVLPDLVNPDPLTDLARQIISELSQPYMINGNSLTIGCSIGIAIAPANGDTSDELVRNADLALYAAKADGRGVHRFYQAEMHAGAKQRKRLEDDLRVALSKDELAVAYQAQVSTANEKIVGYEALVRWNHPARGPISPEDFVPVAEDIRLIEQIGEWVLRKSCEDAAKWPSPARVAVNVSPIQFANPKFPEIVLSALTNANLEPERLELELTESVFLDEDNDTTTMFKTLKRIGVRLALDDFGTGYSALGYLKTAPFDKIKIDQSFIRGAAVVGNRNAAIIKSIVSLAETLDMETTAEGVELKDEIELVKQLGCSHIQGYIYGKPMPHDAVVEQLGEGAGVAKAEGHQASRSPRKRLLRSVSVEVDGRVSKGLIRNISATGAMVEGLRDVEVGATVRIEVIEGQMFHSTVRWSDTKRAGIEFARNFDLEKLNSFTARPRPNVRRVAAS